jgi:chemotaxis protein methyltransferase CheR
VDLEVWATDICSRTLDRAVKGEYEPYDLNRGLRSEERWKFFQELGTGTARVHKKVQKYVQFERLNLLADPPRKNGFHVVLCRNVAIYFDRAGKERLYRTLSDAVIPGGYAVLGAAETLYPSIPEFETVYFERFLLFRKLQGGPP